MTNSLATPDYAELHAHSYYSFLDGVCSPAAMAQEAERLGLSGLALIDHDGLYGVVQFAEAARELGLPTVFGSELTIGATARHNGLPDPPGEHLVVLARNKDGYASLSSAIATANLAGSKGKPQRVLTDLAEVHHGQWTVLTGCRKGTVPAALERGGMSAAERALDELIETFGQDNVVIELWNHHNPEDDDRNDALFELATKRKLAYVATTNAHYAHPGFARLAHATAAIRARRDLGEMNGWLPASPAAHLRSPAEQARRFARYPGAVAQAAEIAKQCAFNLKLVAPDLPPFPCPDGLTEAAYLRQLTEKGATKRYGPRHDPAAAPAWKRIDYELEIIEKLKFPGYFLIVWDIVREAHERNIYCQGRGSAANSTVCYTLEITNCDPVKHNLLFERFLSPERDGPPDIDVDFESERREEIIQYVYERYGRTHTAQVANVNTYRPRMAIRDAARCLGHEIGSIDAWTKHIDHYGRTAAAVDADSTIPDQVLELATQLLDFPRHLSIHSGGMVICSRPVIEVCPVEWATAPGRSVLQWDKDDCATGGLVKFDLLGLGMLEALHRINDVIENFYGEKIDRAHLPQEPEVYKMLSAADTVGVFQVESRAQMATLPRLQPECFYDLVIEVALIRPGPIQGGAVHPYLRRRAGREEKKPLHPLLENTLSRTMGVPIFQEQLMRMAIEVAGFSPAESDELRQAMGSKRSAQRMEKLRPRLFDGLAENGIVGDDAEKIFNALIGFASFGFPESHAISFANLVYESAYLKYHYPAAFLVGLLNSQPMGFWSPSSLIADAQRHGVVVNKADVNYSHVQARLERSEGEAQVRLGLSGIKHISKEVAQRLVDAAPYRGLDDLAQRTRLSQPQLEALANAGALASLDHGDRRKSMWAAALAAAQTEDQLPGLVFTDSTPELPKLSQDETLIADLEMTSLSVDASPMKLLEQQLQGVGRTPADQLPLLTHGQKVSVAGVITHRQRPETAGGITFLSLEDESGLINVVCSKQVWQAHRIVARSALALLIHGRIETADGSINVVAQRMEELDMPIAPPVRNFH